jgi:hypothetical protein
MVPSAVFGTSIRTAVPISHNSESRDQRGVPDASDKDVRRMERSERLGRAPLEVLLVCTSAFSCDKHRSLMKSQIREGTQQKWSSSTPFPSPLGSLDSLGSCFFLASAFADDSACWSIVTGERYQCCSACTALDRPRNELIVLTLSSAGQACVVHILT